MTERFDTGRGQLVVVTPAEPSRGPTIAIILIAIVIIIILIVVAIILILRSRTIVTGPPAITIQCATNNDCSGNQVCSPAGQCVECLGDQDCPLSAPVCDTSTNRCGQCQTDADCPTGASHCNSTTKRCVACVSNSQCTVDRPLCNPSNGVCVQCLNTGQCTKPKTCLNGTCCDIVAPILTSLTSISPGVPVGNGNGNNALVSITGTYTTSPGQPQAGQVAIAEISDRNNVALRTTSGIPAVGTITVSQIASNENIRFYAGYPYQMRVRVSTPCGETQYSNRLSTVTPIPSGAIIPIIESATANRDGVTIFLSNPDGNTLPITWEPRVYFTHQTDDPNGLLDPNRALIQDNTVVTTAPPRPISIHVVDPTKPLLKVFASWPSGSGSIQPGQQWFLRVGGSTGVNAIVLSEPFQVTVS